MSTTPRILARIRRYACTMRARLAVRRFAARRGRHIRLGSVVSNIGFIVRGDVGHDIVFALRSRLFILTGISEEEAQIGDGIIALGRFHTSDGVIEAVLLHKGVEATAFHSLARHSNYLLDATRGIHDGQGSSKAIEEQSSTRLVGLIRWAKGELGGQV